ncbi:MAG: extracellular solute-binding protein [Verrucomicrobiota bacterium]
MMRHILNTGILFSVLGFGHLFAGDLTLYSHRHYESDDALFQKFTEESGIKVNVVKAKADELIERLKAEGENSPADLFMTADAGNLQRAKSQGVLQTISSEVLDAAIPENLRDPDGEWYGITQRARVLVYAKDRNKPEDFSSYEDLADPKWRGQILVRSSSNIYNQSLMASIIAAHGEEKAEEWAAAVRKNMARPPQGSDRDQMRAVAAGLGDVAIVNTYYLGLLVNSDDPKDQEVGNSVAIFFPNQAEGDRGTHVNISGAGVTKYSKNVKEATQLLELS